jgi:hypothetical protein
MTCSVTSTTTATTAGKAGDNDVEQTGDGSNDGLEDRSNAIDDCHQAGADGAADGFDLRVLLVALIEDCGKRDVHKRLQLPF